MTGPAFLGAQNILLRRTDSNRHPSGSKPRILSIGTLRSGRCGQSRTVAATLMRRAILAEEHSEVEALRAPGDTLYGERQGLSRWSGDRESHPNFERGALWFYC